MTDLKTHASFALSGSFNPMAFNAVADAEARISLPSAPFAPGFLKANAQAFFNEAVRRIESQKFSHLCNTMIANSCNKPTAHNYTQLYDVVLDGVRKGPLHFIEVGIGTNNQDVPSMMAQTYSPGASLRGWRDYFEDPGMTVIGADVDPRVLFREPRIETGYINQLNPSSIVAFLQRFGFMETGIDVILDDGLHEFRSNFTLLVSAWAWLRPNGLFIIEDIDANTFAALQRYFGVISLSADIAAFELPSYSKADNRVIMLQKT